MPWAVLNRQSTTPPDEALAHIFKYTHFMRYRNLRFIAGDTKAVFTQLVYSTFYAILQGTKCIIVTLLSASVFLANIRFRVYLIKCLVGLRDRVTAT